MTAAAVALIALVAALPGLLRSAGGPWIARGCALLAVLVLGSFAVDPVQTVADARPASVVRVEAAAVAPDDLLRAGPRADELQLVWREGASPAWPVAGRGARALAPGALPFDPDALRLLLPAAARAGRPLLVELTPPPLGESPTAGDPARGSLRLLDPAGEVLGQVEWEWSGGSAPPATVALPATPEVVGRHRLEWTLAAGSHQVVGAASVEVGDDTQSVLAIGPEAAAVAAALEVQGLACRAETDWPEGFRAPWTGVDTLIATGALTGEQQELVRQYVEDGGGAFFVGAATPVEDEPLGAWSPVLRHRVVEDGGGADGGAGTDPAATDPPPPGAEPPPATPPDGPPTGETQGAELDPGAATEVERRTVAMVLLVDRSGSMGSVTAAGRSVIDYARLAALRTSQRLQDGDRIAIITFGRQDAPQVVLPLTAVGEQATIRAAVERLNAFMEGTYLSGAVRAARDLLEQAPEGVRQVVVLTDGEFLDGDSLQLLSNVRDLREKARATFSIVRVAPSSQYLVRIEQTRKLVNAGGGRSVIAEDPESVPEIVSAEVVRVAGRGPESAGGNGPGDRGASPPPPDPDRPNPIDPAPSDPAPSDPALGDPDPTEPKVGDPADPAAEASAPAAYAVRSVTDSGLLAPPRTAPWPSVGGLYSGVARPDGHVLLVAGDDGAPLLAFANRGLGRVAVWTSHWFGPWGRAWIDDAEFPGRLAQWVESLRRAVPTAPAGALASAWEAAPAGPLPALAAAWGSASGASVLAPTEAVAVPSLPVWIEAPKWRRWWWLAWVALVALALGEWGALRWRGR